MAHGRYLAGLGGENETQVPWDPDYREDFMRDLEKEDDVYGSGIFDTYGRDPTVNPDMGVFSDNPSLPGFIDREVQYQVSKDIYDIANGADVVTVASGGMTYQEKGGLSVPFDRAGMAPCPPPRALPPPTKMNQVYVDLWPTPPASQINYGPPVFKPLPPGTSPPPSPPGPPMMVQQGRPYYPPRVPAVPAVTGEAQMVATVVPPGYIPRANSQGPYPGPVPFTQGQGPVGYQQIQNAAMPAFPAGDGYSPRPVPFIQQTSPVDFNQIVQTGSPTSQVPAAANGFGRFGLGRLGDSAPAKPSSPPGWGTYAFAGLLVGASAAMLYGAMNVKKKAR